MSRPRWRTGAIAATFAVATLSSALLFYAARLPPLDLSRTAERSPVILDREGRLLRAFTTDDGRWRLPVGADDVDPRYLALLKAYEDRRFDRHGGIDAPALLRAASQVLANGRIVSGGSTLTMQVARLIEPRAERSLDAKLRQIVRARELENRLTKRDILGLYLSLAPFGGNLEGVRAASLAYFGKEPKRLSTAEAALLVALPQSPETRRPDRFPAGAREARGRVLARAVAAGLIGTEEAAHAGAEPLPTARQPLPVLAPHAAEAALAERPAERVQRLTLDARLQAGLESLARERAQQIGPKLSVAMLVIDNASGEIRASVGGGDYFASERAGSLDLTRALRSPGSALKPFIYALAFENGIAHPETMLEDRPTRFHAYAPENFDLTFQGMVTARKALQLSLNVPAVDLLALVGPQRFLARLKEAGAGIALPRDAVPSLAVGLGGLGITLHDLAKLYAAIARGGEALDLRIRPDILRPDAPRPEGLRLFDPVTSWYVADTLLGAPPPQNAAGHRLAFKTGTSYGYRDAWAVGFDRRHTVAVWVGRADNGAVPGLVGRVVAAPILFEAFARIGIEPGVAPRPAGTLVATSAALPPPLRHLRHDVPKTLSALTQAPLRVAFPPDGASVDLAASALDGERLLMLKASGGAPPFTWLVDGQPIGGADARRSAPWRPAGAGFARISVVDGQGNSDSVAIRLR